MPTFQGHCRLSLGGEDCNRLLQRIPDAPIFRAGCFSLHRKLPLGFGATLVIVPTYSPGFIILNVPFDQIRGDRTGGIAATIANLLWSWIRDAVQKNLSQALVGQGCPPDTVCVDLSSDPGGQKVGRIIFDLDRLNAGLGRHWFGPGLRATVVGFQPRPESLEVVLAIWKD
jgi:hypothetical protein